MSDLALSQKMRDRRALDERIEEILLSAKDVTPADRKKLKGLLEYYAKKPHPFTACVRDNRKRFGPGAEAVCATLKDIIRGTTHWRKGGHKSAMSDTQLVTMMLAMARETRRKVGFHALSNPAIIVLKVSPADAIQRELLYPQKKMSSMFTPRPTHGEASLPVT